ncbi:hypothetical protein JYU15_01355, partial [bacterium AH-315-I18]|nr:hypothetical protein [bacterium AH-315-I18]
SSLALTYIIRSTRWSLPSSKRITQILQSKPKSACPSSPPLLKGDLRKTYHQTRERIWVYQRRRDVSTTLTKKLAIVNSQILKLFGTTSQNSSDQLTSPWREMIRIDGPEHASAATFTSQIKSYRNRGLFDPQSYDLQTIKDESDELNNIIKQLQSQEAQVLIMLMPEYSTLRQAVPAIALQRLKSNLKIAFGDTAPQIIDMRESLPDELFSDISHVNSAGRAAYSKRIAPILARQMQ